jgi:hypothetical protein
MSAPTDAAVREILVRDMGPFYQSAVDVAIFGIGYRAGLAAAPAPKPDQSTVTPSSRSPYLRGGPEGRESVTDGPTVGQPKTREQRLENALGFFASCIRSGEAWDDICQRAYDDAVRQDVPAPKPAAPTLHAWRDLPEIEALVKRELGSEYKPAAPDALVARNKVQKSLLIPDEEADEFRAGWNESANYHKAHIESLTAQVAARERERNTAIEAERYWSQRAERAEAERDGLRKCVEAADAMRGGYIAARKIAGFGLAPLPAVIIDYDRSRAALGEKP